MVLVATERSASMVTPLASPSLIRNRVHASTSEKLANVSLAIVAASSTVKMMTARASVVSARNVPLANLVNLVYLVWKSRVKEVTRKRERGTRENISPEELLLRLPKVQLLLKRELASLLVAVVIARFALPVTLLPSRLTRFATTTCPENAAMVPLVVASTLAMFPRLLYRKLLKLATTSRKAAAASGTCAADNIRFTFLEKPLRTARIQID